MHIQGSRFRPDSLPWHQLPVISSILRRQQQKWSAAILEDWPPLHPGPYRCSRPRLVRGAQLADAATSSQFC